MPEQEIQDTPEVQLVRRIAGSLIPASREHGIPGADDPLIFERVLHAVSRAWAPLMADLRTLGGPHGSPEALLALDAADFDEAVARAIGERAAKERLGALGALLTAVLQAYYTDQRVLRSLGKSPDPPFPHGNDIAQGDWTLLDPVRLRPRLYRDA
jgi:hypothetical protein